MTEHHDEFDRAARLTARANEVVSRFLATEVQAGMTLLDTADASQDVAANERRRALALEAYDVVSERLARTGAAALILSDEEREEFVRAHAELGRRLGR